MREDGQLKQRPGGRPHDLRIKHIDGMGCQPQCTYVESCRGSNNRPDVRRVLKHVAVEAEDSRLSEHGSLIPGRLMNESQHPAGSFDIRQLSERVIRAAVEGTPATRNLLPDFRRLSIKKIRRDDKADHLLRRRLQQFKDGLGAFEHEDAFAVTRALCLDDISYVREKVAGNGAK